MSAIRLPATLTITEARATLAQLQQAIAADVAPSIDASGLGQLDTAAIAVLLDCRRAAAAAGKPLPITGMPPKLAQLAQLYGVDALIAAA